MTRPYIFQEMDIQIAECEAAGGKNSAFWKALKEILSLREQLFRLSADTLPEAWIAQISLKEVILELQKEVTLLRAQASELELERDEALKSLRLARTERLLNV